MSHDQGQRRRTTSSFDRGVVALFLAAFAIHFGCASDAGVRAIGVEAGLPAVSSATDEDVHAELFRKDQYPSARQCAACHQAIYDEWRSSSHAYSGLSPMFHKFEQALNTLAQGTVGAFCVRCHLPVGTAAGQPRHMSLFDRAEDTERFEDPIVSIEGVTCIACHRVDESYGRVNGQRRIVPGTMFEPMFGSGTGAGLEDVLANPEGYNVTTDANSPPGRIKVHQTVETNPELAESQFCVSCHQVAVHPGIKLEVVWDQFLASPAHTQGKTCQDCHMGVVPGKWQGGYAQAHRATVNGQPVGELARHANHAFVGPGYSIAHPGIFPHHPQGLKDPRDPEGPGFTLREWMTFDWRQPWGEQDFEAALAAGNADGNEIPPEWSDPARRREARNIITENQALLEARKEKRREVMENGSHIDGPFFDAPLASGEPLRFHYVIENTCEGHNLPSGSLGAQPQVWLNVALVGPDGERLWESGYVDSVGDLADLHSKDVLAGELPHDDQLVNLQSKFLTTNLKGTDREMYLPVPFDGDQLPFIRPAGQPTTVMNHPPFIRMEQRSIPPLGTRKASYTVPAELISKPGKYRLAVRMRSRAEPIYFMSFVGATDEMIRSMNERMVDIHPYTVEFEVR